MANPGWAKVLVQARRQYGLITMAQCAAQGLEREAVYWRVERGELRAVSPALYAFTSVRETWSQRALSALLRFGPDSALSHHAAAHLHALDGFKKPLEKIELLVPRESANAARSRLPDWLVLHRTQALPETSTVAGLRRTTLARTLIDLSAVLSDDALDDALDSGLRSDPFLQTDLMLALEWPWRGFKGVPRLTALLDERGGLATESRLENRVFRYLRRSGLPIPRFQKRFFDAESYVARPDFTWERQRVCLHADGFAYHHGRRHFEIDRTAVNRLAALGYQSVFVTWRTVDTLEWVEAVRRLLTTREPQLDLALQSRTATVPSTDSG